MTSLFFRSINDSAKFRAAVPLFTATHSSEPMYFLNSFSNFSTLPIPAPDAQKPLLSTLITACSSFLSITGSKA